MAISFLTVVEGRIVGTSDTIRPRCPEADRHIRKCQGKRGFIYTNFSLLEVQSSLTIGSSFRASSNIFGFEVGPYVRAFGALRKDGGSSNNGLSPLMDSRGKKKVTAARLLQGEKLTYPVRRFVFHPIYQLQAYCDRSDNDKEQCQELEGRGVQ